MDQIPKILNFYLQELQMLKSKKGSVLTHLNYWYHYTGQLPTSEHGHKSRLSPDS